MVALILVTAALVVFAAQATAPSGAGDDAGDALTPEPDAVDVATEPPRVTPDAPTGAGASKPPDDGGQPTPESATPGLAAQPMSDASLGALVDLAEQGPPAGAPRLVIDSHWRTTPGGDAGDSPEVSVERLIVHVAHEPARESRDLVSGDARVTIAFAFAYRAPANADEPGGWTVYDSTLRRRVPLTVSLDAPDLPRALRQGLVGARVGETRLITAPARWAYGEQGRPPVPPNATQRMAVRVIDVGEDKAPRGGSEGER